MVPALMTTTYYGQCIYFNAKQNKVGSVAGMQLFDPFCCIIEAKKEIYMAHRLVGRLKSLSSTTFRNGVDRKSKESCQ